MCDTANAACSILSATQAAPKELACIINNFTWGVGNRIFFVLFQNQCTGTSVFILLRDNGHCKGGHFVSCRIKFIYHSFFILSCIIKRKRYTYNLPILNKKDNINFTIFLKLPRKCVFKKQKRCSALPEHLCAYCAIHSRRFFRNIFPVVFFGSSSMNSIFDGTLYLARCPLQNSNKAASSNEESLATIKA